MVKYFKLKVSTFVKKYRRRRISSLNRQALYSQAEKYIRKNSLENEYDFNSDFELSGNLLNQNRYNEAEQTLKRLEQLHHIAPDNGRFKWLNGQAKLRLARLEYKRLRVAKAIAYLNSIEFYSGFNDFYVAHEFLARLYRYQNDYKSAFDTYNKIIKTNFRQIEKISQSYFEVSREVFPDLSPEEVLEKEHGLEVGYFSALSLARYYLSISNYEKALKFTQEVPSSDVNRFLLMGDIYLQEGDYGRSRMSFYRAWMRAPLHLESIKSYFWAVAGSGSSLYMKVLVKLLIRIPFIKSKRTAYRKLAMLSGDTYSVLDSYQGTVGTNGLLKSLPDKYIESLDVSELSSKSVLVLPLWGIGDEIIVASVYQDLYRFAAAKNIKLTIATEPRLLSLMERSFPEHDFVSVSRKHRGPHLNKVSEQDVLQDRVLPNQDLYYTLDYSTWEKMDEYDCVIPAPTAARDLRQAIGEFGRANGQYLIPDSGKAAKLQRRLDAISSKPKIGISWRSGYGSMQRALYYTKISQWEEIFKLSEHVDFVNLQYDNCGDELEYVKSEFGVDIISLDDVDLFDDLESVCALISTMDMTIAPCTVMAEFSGALGVRTLYLANSVEAGWRFDDSLGDIWFDSIQFVVPDRYGDNSSMLLNASNEIRKQLLIDH